MSATTAAPRPPIRAAGGVLWRPVGTGGGIEVAVIHRPKYDDWSLPKGKLEPGESELDAALREVAEETGYDSEPGPVLGERRYRTRTRRGELRPKVVRYWSLRALRGGFCPNDEVDALEWLVPEHAARRCTHADDGRLVAACAGLLRRLPAAS